MQRYQNKSGRSGITDYELGERSILVRFIDGDTYLYGYNAPGPVAVEEMKKRAIQGSGLATYISTHVRDAFERKVA